MSRQIPINRLGKHGILYCQNSKSKLSITMSVCIRMDVLKSKVSRCKVESSLGESS